jgi:hypothetical protein
MFKESIRRIISLVLVFTFLCGVFITPVSAASGTSSGANSHIQAYIAWSAGKQVSIADFKNAKFTQDELQFLGVYLSNFYVPFGTELGTTDKVTEQNKADMKQALQTSLAFNDEMAASFVETTLKLSRDTTQELKLYVSKDYQSGLVEVPDVPLNYYTALSCMLGGLKEVLNEYPMDKENAEIKQIKAGLYDYGYWGYVKNGKVVPVFDFDIDLSSLTPSNTAFIKCLESVDMKNGYGTAFFDFKKDEVATDKGSFGLVNKSVNADQAYQMSAYGQKLAVDCFGNIIVRGANHQVIAVPGCMNPYTWQEVDANGAAVGLGLGGTAFNLASVPALSLQTGSGTNTLFSNISASSGNTADQVTESGDREIRVEFTGSLGSSNITNAGKELGYLKALLNYSMGYNEGETGQYNIFFTGNTVGIVGKASELSKIRKELVTYENLERNNRGDLISIKNDLAEYIEKSKVNGQNWVTIDTNFDEVAKKAQEQLQGKPVSSETAKVGVRSGLVATNVLMSNLNSMRGQQYVGKSQEYSFRLIRGSSDSAINTAGIIDVFSENGIKELIKSCEKGFKTANPNAYNYFLGRDGGLSGVGYLGEKAAHDIQFNADVGDGSEIKGPRTTTLFDSFVFIDNLGAMNYNNSSAAVDFKPVNILSYFDSSQAVESTKNSFSSWASSPNNGYTNMYKDIQEGKSIIPQGVSGEALVGIYVTYAYASLYDKNSTEEIKNTIGKLGYRMNTTALPTITSTALTLSAAATEDAMNTAIRDWLYYLLNPTEGFNYFRILISNKVNALLVGWHEDMVGSDGTGLINGTTYYRGDTGYVTTPELQDVPWIAAIIDFFVSAFPYLVILMMLLLVAVYMGGSLSMQRCIIAFVLFVFALSLPLPIINNIIGASNRVSTTLYGEKFTYWALVQHESYSDAIDKAAENGDYANYLRTLYAENSKVSANQGSESVMLRWQAPKKLDSLMFGKDDVGVSSQLVNSSLMSGLFGSAYSGENYLKDEDALYLYRSYIDISNASRYIHRGLVTGIQPVSLSLDNTVTSSWYDGLKNSMESFETQYENDRSLGYCNPNGDGSTSGNGTSLLRVKLPLSSHIVTDAFNGRGTVSDLGIDQYVGINQGAFNFAIPMFNTKNLDYYDQLNSNTFNAEQYSREDYSALAAYSLMSENVFYYFSWDLYESGLSTDSGSKEGFKKLLLGKENAGFFYNTGGNGEMKDFMDMRSLFTYTIPYLKQGNDLVDEWDNTYGLFFYEGVPTEEGKEAEVADNPELKQKYWHNLNVARLHGVWTPWVDLMYDCSYARPEKISYLGEEYVVTDPINPASYPEERPMIFSRSEMTDYGLKVNQLTAVERKIIECNDGMEERLFNLLNYYKFNDVVLNTAAAMNCSFEFNKQFSENGLLGENHNIYPQAFELADFSYDAFLRFILANTTSESMIVEPGESFYSNVVNHSSIVTAIMMIILDILSVYVVPTFKLFFILGIFLLSIVLVMMSALKVDSERNFVTRFIGSLLKPMGLFFVITTGFAFIVSMFMGSGNSAVTGELTPSISVGDPVVVMVIMAVLNMATVYLYYKLIRGVWLEVIRGGQAVFNVFAGAVTGFGGAVMGRISDKFASKSPLKTTETGTPAQSSGVMGSSKLSNGVPAMSATARGYTTFNVFGQGNADDRGASGFNRTLSKNRGLSKESQKEEDVLKKKSKIEEKIKEGANKTTNAATKAVDKVGTAATEAAEKKAKELEMMMKMMV